MPAPFLNSSLLAWGNRGHVIVGEAAAKLIAEKFRKSSKAEEKYLSELFKQAASFIAEASNIPDSAWRGAAEGKAAQDLNGPTHYINAEEFLGAPPADISKFLIKMRSLPGDYGELLKLYQNQISPLSQSEIQVFRVGVAPWRVEVVFQYLGQAFRCYKSKLQMGIKDLSHPRVPAILGVAQTKTLRLKDIPEVAYRCNPEQNRFDDIDAALVFVGILSHFVADLTQPYHVSKDYDGWLTGQGGIHAYFETEVVNAYDRKLEADIASELRNPSFRKKIFSELNLSNLSSESHGVSRAMLRLAADSYAQKQVIAHWDQKVAIEKKGSVLGWNDHTKGEHLKKARRRKPSSPIVLHAFRRIIIERLKIASLVLSELILLAWKEAGRPDLEPYLAKSNLLSPPEYLLHPPFFWPSFDRPAVERALNNANTR